MTAYKTLNTHPINQSYTVAFLNFSGEPQVQTDPEFITMCIRKNMKNTAIDYQRAHIT
jgi:hypothetical protein